MSGGIDVSEDGSDLLPLQRVRRGDEREGGNDDLTLEIQGARRDLERDSPVAHCHAVLHVQELRDALLELLRNGPIVRKPATIEDVAGALKETLVVADVRAPDVEGLGEHGRRAINGEVGR